MLLKIPHRQHAKFVFIDSLDPDTITMEDYTHFIDERGETKHVNSSQGVWPFTGFDLLLAQHGTQSTFPE